MNKFTVCLLIGSLAFLGSHASADRLVLKNGVEIHAKILKSDDTLIAADLGYTVLSLPKEWVIQIDTAESQTAADTPAKEDKPLQEWQLYRSAKLEPATIEENTIRFSEAVVMVNTPNGLGSGFLISPDGYLITNFHVIAGETLLRITVFRKTPTGFEQKAYKKVKIIALNPYVDLALLKIEEAGESFVYAYLGDMSDVQVGQDVFAIGNPLGLTRTVSQGIVSTKNRNFEGQLFIQTTTDINPGNSGGPLFNMKGEIIGVTSMGYIFLGGLNFAIPVDVVKRFIDNRDAFAYDEDNPNAGFRYLQPSGKNNTESKSGDDSSAKIDPAETPDKN